MCKDTTIFSELQEFFLQNDAHLAINRISDVMNSLRLHKNKIGGLFADVTSGTMELSIVEKIWLLIIEVVTAIAEQVSADYDELMEAAINGNKHLKLLFEPYLMEKQIA